MARSIGYASGERGVKTARSSRLPAACRSVAWRDRRVIRPGSSREMLVALSREPGGVVAELDRRVLRGIRRRAAAWQAFNERVVIRIAEEWDRIAIAVRSVDHTMGCRQEALVRPAMQDVAAVHHERILDTGSVDPAPVGQLDREAGH